MSMKKLLIGLLAFSSVSTMAFVKDVGGIGPNSEVILYYKEGNHIIVKNCAPNTVLGLTPAEARESCQGEINKVPLEAFKMELKKFVSVKNAKVLKPLTEEEASAYMTGNLEPEQIKELKVELDKINVFITNYGEENANLDRKRKIEARLLAFNNHLSAVNKVNIEIENVVKTISSQTKVTLTKFNPNNDQFFYTVLKKFNPEQKFVCGLVGSIEERIKDCNYSTSSHIGDFVLVTRVKNPNSSTIYEVHQETSTGLLWGSNLIRPMNQSEAQKNCKNAFREGGYISDIDWKLPSKEEFEVALDNGIAPILGLDKIFWTSSVHSEKPNTGWLVTLYIGTRGDYYPSNKWHMVRCVGEYKRN